VPNSQTFQSMQTFRTVAVVCVLAVCQLAASAQSPSAVPTSAVPNAPAWLVAQQTETAQVSAWNLLTKSFMSKKASTRVDSIAALSTIPNNSRVLSMIESALSDSKPEVRAQAASSLAEMNARSSISKIKPLLTDKSPEVTFAAARALSQLGDQSGRDVLIEVITGDRKVSGSLVDSGVTWAKQFTVTNLLFLGAAEGATIFAGPFGAVGVSAVRQLVGDRSSTARASSAQALASDGGERAVEILEKALHDKNWTVRFSAANALGFAPTPEPIPQLSALLHDKKFPVRLVSAASIVRLASLQTQSYDLVNQQQPMPAFTQ